jgi:DNA-binding SARP family transcriptional activator/tetratricopeptide (TPR) repeat protein
MLAFLALNRARPVSRDELELAVWGLESGDHRGGVSSLLSRLRRELGPDAIHSRGRTSVQMAEHVTVDYHEAGHAVAQARQALMRGAAEHAAAAARRALPIAERGVMHGETAVWLEDWRHELAELGVRAREQIAEAALLTGGPELQTAADRAREMVKAEPYSESAHGVLIRVLAAQGNVAQALEVYEELRGRLREELGVTPGPQMRALHALLLGAPAPSPTTRSPERDAARTASAHRISSRGRAPFVGREHELAALRELFDDPGPEGCRLVLLEGEPGIGKTRLAMQFAQDCQRGGAVTLYGRCDSDTVVPYQPFVEALRCALANTLFAPLRDRIPSHLTEVARMLPELAAEVGPATGGQSTVSDERAERFRLFDAVGAVLAEVSKAHPVLLILDDLHWADKPTLLMLRQVVRSAGDASMLVLGTYRDTERGGELLDTLADLRREHVFHRITLRGLDQSDATELIEQITDDVPPLLGRTLWEECRGNPFFLEEMLRQRTAGGDPARTSHSDSDSLPDAVKDVIGRRLARVSKRLRTVLEIACVAGNEFSVDVLERLSGLTEDELDEALREAIEAHLIEELPAAYGRFAFEHSLTRQTLYEDLTLTRRARLHLRVGEELERLDGQRSGQRLAELAHHFLHAPPERGPSKAAHYAVCAARHAMQVFAYEEAVRHYEVSLAALERQPDRDERRHELLLALGEAQVKAGDTRRARVSFREAGDLARVIDSPAGFAKAALGGAQISGGVIDDEMVRRLEEALGWLGTDDEILRSRLLSRLVIELSFARDERRLATLSEEAVAVARRCGDAGALTVALIARHWSLWAPENIEERLQTATELLTLAAGTGSANFALKGHRWRMMDLLELGEVDEADSAINAYAELAERRRVAAELWYADLFRAMRMLMSGRYADAEPACRAAFELGHRVGDPNAHQAYTLQMLVLRRDRGDLSEVEDGVRINVQRYPAIPGWRCVLAHLLCEIGKPDEARRELAQLTDRSFAVIPRDGLWLAAIAHLAEVAASLREVEPAAELYDLLAPFASRNVVVGWAATCLGSAARLLAMLAAVLDREDDAKRHFEQALAMNERMGAQPWVTRTRFQYARFLLDSGQATSAGHDLLEQALADARRLEMLPILEQAKGLVAARTS